ncbi:MAG TPA: hypothetical protein PK156_35490, partial [Polyangium sp.]|nr:hypothetical protein [Polyangium sp.]
GRSAKMLAFPQMRFETCYVRFCSNKRARIIFFERKRDKRLRFVELSFGERDAIQLRPKTCSLGKELLRTFTVAPKIVGTEEEVEFGEASRLPGKVKDRRGAGSDVDVTRRVVR